MMERVRRRGIWVAASAVVAGAALTGLVVGGIHSTNRIGGAETAVVEQEADAAPAPRDLKTSAPATLAPAPTLPVVDETVVEGSEPRVPRSRAQLPPPLSTPGVPGLRAPEEPAPGSGLGASVPTTGIVLGDTTDEVGNHHSLVLNVPEEARNALLHADGVFAVVSGVSRLSVTGDAAAQQWRFTVDATATGAEAPIVVVKTQTNRAMQDLASDPNAYASASTLNDAPTEIALRLTALMTDVISKAEPTGPNSDLYAELARMILDPHWTGVMVFNATATVPSEVAGRLTGALADSTVTVVNIGFTESLLASGPRSFFGTIDQSHDRGDELPAGVEHLRARFSNGVLVAFEQG